MRAERRAWSFFNENRIIHLTDEELAAAEECSRKGKRICSAGNTSGDEIVLVQAAEPGRILVRFSLPRLIQAQFQDRALFTMDTESSGYMEVVMLEIAGVKRNLYFPIPDDFEGTAGRSLPFFILAGGVIITVLLFIVFHSLADSRNRAVEMAQKMTSDLREATQRAVEANKAKSEFLASMSHEIRNPLNVIAGMGEILAGTDLAGEQRRYLDTLRKAGVHLQSLINDILDLSRIESGQLELEAIDFPLRSTLEGLHDLYTMTAREKGLEFKLDLDPALPAFISGDPVRLRQIIVNLLGNAFKFTSIGSVTLSARMDGGFLTLSVTDTGIGIPPEKQAAIFEKFTQVDASTTRKYGGTGLGLAICKRLTEMMGGQLKISSTAGQGQHVLFQHSRFRSGKRTGRTNGKAADPAPEGASDSTGRGFRRQCPGCVCFPEGASARTHARNKRS
jgi:signal transduction histidine kinase